MFVWHREITIPKADCSLTYSSARHLAPAFQIAPLAQTEFKCFVRLLKLGYSENGAHRTVAGSRRKLSRSVFNRQKFQIRCKWDDVVDWKVGLLLAWLQLNSGLQPWLVGLGIKIQLAGLICNYLRIWMNSTLHFTIFARLFNFALSKEIELPGMENQKPA